jgi:hypothetical protein
MLVGVAGRRMGSGETRRTGKQPSKQASKQASDGHGSVSESRVVYMVNG